MEMPEAPTEHLHEHLHEKAHEHHGHAKKSSWVMGVALSSAILAAFAAVCALLAGHYANEAMLDQIKASDQWNYYQSKSIKAALLTSKIDTLVAIGKTADEKDVEKVAEYKKEQEEIKKEAEEKEHHSKAYLHSHTIFARGLTMFQVAIAIGAISALTEKRRFWFVSLVFGLVGLFFFIQGFVH